MAGRGGEFLLSPTQPIIRWPGEQRCHRVRDRRSGFAVEGMTVTDIQTSLEWIERGFIADDTVDPSDVPRASHEVSLGASLGRVEAVARLHADKVAVTDGRTSLTYAELLDRSCGLAADIVASTHPGAVVASLLHNGPAGICTVVATGAAGADLRADRRRASARTAIGAVPRSRRGRGDRGERLRDRPDGAAAGDPHDRTGLKASRAGRPASTSVPPATARAL